MGRRGVSCSGRVDGRGSQEGRALARFGYIAASGMVDMRAARAAMGVRSGERTELKQDGITGWSGRSRRAREKRKGHTSERASERVSE